MADPPIPARRNVQAVTELEAQLDAERNAVDRVADRITRFGGSPWFVLMHVVWFAAWIGLGTWGPLRKYDPFPYFFLTFLVSLEAIVLTGFVLNSQQHLGRQARRRAALDLQINLLAEAETTKMLELMHAIADHLGVPYDVDDESREMMTKTDVAALVDALEAAESSTQAGSSEKKE